MPNQLCLTRWYITIDPGDGNILVLCECSWTFRCNDYTKAYRELRLHRKLHHKDELDRIKYAESCSC